MIVAGDNIRCGANQPSEKKIIFKSFLMGLDAILDQLALVRSRDWESKEL